MTAPHPDPSAPHIDPSAPSTSRPVRSAVPALALGVAALSVLMALARAIPLLFLLPAVVDALPSAALPALQSGVPTVIVLLLLVALALLVREARTPDDRLAGILWAVLALMTLLPVLTAVVFVVQNVVMVTAGSDSLSVYSAAGGISAGLGMLGYLAVALLALLFSVRTHAAGRAGGRAGRTLRLPGSAVSTAAVLLVLLVLQLLMIPLAFVLNAVVGAMDPDLLVLVSGVPVHLGAVLDAVAVLLLLLLIARCEGRALRAAWAVLAVYALSCLADVIAEVVMWVVREEGISLTTASMLVQGVHVLGLLLVIAAAVVALVLAVLARRRGARRAQSPARPPNTV